MSGKRQGPKGNVGQGDALKKAELEPVDQRLMKGLSRPLRVQILTLINERPWSPRELQQELNEGLSQISYHVKVLKEYDLIELVDTKPVRGAVEHFYSPTQRIIIPEGMSAELPKSARLEMLAKIIGDAEKDVHEALKDGSFYAREDFHASWTPMDLDEQGCADLHTRADRFLEDVLKIAAESANRRADEGTEGIPISIALFAFGSAREPGKRKPAHRRWG